MINGISFTGRETMLTQPTEKVVSKVHEYVAASKIYSTAENAVKEAAKDITKTANPICSNQAAASYALSHGTPKEVLPEAVARSIAYTI